MTRVRGGLLSLVLVVVVLGTTTHAMPIVDFDKMPKDDQASYVILLLDQSVKYLREREQHEMAKTIINEFNAKGSKGMEKFLENLDIARGVGRGTGKPIEVEHAMQLTLREMKISIPTNELRQFASGFKPARR